MIALNNLRSQIKLISSQTKLHVYCKDDFGLHAQGSIVCIFGLDEDNDVEEKLINLFNEVFYFHIWKKNTTNQDLNILKTCIVIRVKFQRFQQFLE